MRSRSVRSLIDEKKKQRMRGAREKDDQSVWSKKANGNERANLPIARKENFSLNDQSLANQKLFRGAMLGNPDMIRSALAEGADIETKGAHGETVLTQACLHNRRGAAGALIYAGANLNAMDGSGGTALMAAAANGYKDIVLMLVDAGAELDMRDDSGKTALRYSVQNSHSEIARFLKQNGAKE